VSAFFFFQSAGGGIDRSGQNAVTILDLRLRLAVAGGSGQWPMAMV